MSIKDYGGPITYTSTSPFEEQLVEIHQIKNINEHVFEYNPMSFWKKTYAITKIVNENIRIESWVEGGDLAFEIKAQLPSTKYIFSPNNPNENSFEVDPSNLESTVKKLAENHLNPCRIKSKNSS